MLVPGPAKRVEIPLSSNALARSEIALDCVVQRPGHGTSCCYFTSLVVFSATGFESVVLLIRPNSEVSQNLKLK